MPATINFYPERAMRSILTPIQQMVLAYGFKMEREIKESMQSGPSGYERDVESDLGVSHGGVSKRGKKMHYASSPGSPPAVDTGRLRASISTSWSGGGFGNESDNTSGEGVPIPESAGANQFKVRVGTRVRYAPYLEFGTSKMAARPFIRPVWEKYRNRISYSIQRAVSRGYR